MKQNSDNRLGFTKMAGVVNDRSTEFSGFGGRWKTRFKITEDTEVTEVEEV